MIEALTWCSMLVMIGLETKVYVCEFRWFVRFGVIYALIGDAVMFNLIFSMKDFYNRFELYTIIYLHHFLWCTVLVLCFSCTVHSSP